MKAYSAAKMKTYTVFAPKNDDRSFKDRVADYRFVKEGYAFWAAIFGPLWLLAKQMWLEALAYFIGLSILLSILQLAGLNEIGSSLFVFLVSIIFALFARDIEAMHLERQGFKMVSLVTGKSFSECEEKYFYALDDEREGE